MELATSTSISVQAVLEVAAQIAAELQTSVVPVLLAASQITDDEATHAAAEQAADQISAAVASVQAAMESTEQAGYGQAETAGAGIAEVRHIESHSILLP